MTFAQSMASGANGYTVSSPLFTVGETINGYTPPGVLDGLGAYELDANTVRVLANHELLNFRGYSYTVEGGAYSLVGSRVSYFDIDKGTRTIVDSGLAYDRIYDADGNVTTDASFLSNDFVGLSRFCSSVLIEPEQFGAGRGLADRIYFTGEEDGGFFNGVGGAEWALDTANGDLWQLPALGRGAWENVTEIDTGTTTHVAILLADDSSPFDHDSDGVDEAAPMYLYVGLKDPMGNFLERNGLSGGSLYVWVSDTAETSPLQFAGSGTLAGSWVEVDNSPTGAPSEDGSTGFDEYGYPTQGNLWIQAEMLGSFGFSRPEDLDVNPANGTQAVLASTGVDTYAVDPMTGNGVDTFGTLYIFDTDFTDLGNPTSDVTILYDGDADPSRALRSPDNLDWADNGFIYVQEDEAEEDTLSGDEVLFGAGAANPNEAGIVRVDPSSAALLRVANIDRSVVLDASIPDPTQAVDVDAGFAGEWESSGILDVSSLFGEAPGKLFIFNVQAHGIEDQDDFNPTSRINDADLVEGGQLLLLEGPPTIDSIGLNEIYASHAGTDDQEYIELFGTPGGSLDGYLVLIVEGQGAGAGTLDRVWDLSGLTVPADGFFVLGDDAVANVDFNIGVDNRIENGTETFYLVRTDEPAAIAALEGSNITMNAGPGAGTTQIPSLATIVDVVAMVDSDFPAEDTVFDGALAVGPDGDFFPAGIFRFGDFDFDWCTAFFLDFDDEANLAQPRNPGEPNVADCSLECFLVFGNGPGTTQWGQGSHVFEAQVDEVVEYYPVLQGDTPLLPLPEDQSGRLGASTILDFQNPQGPNVYYVQVLMYAPLQSPWNPEQYSVGMQVIVTPEREIFTRTYGDADGITFRPEIVTGPDGQEYLTFPFTVQGF